MPKRDMVDRYYDGFRQADQEMVLEHLTDDVIWRVHGCSTLEGKAAFRADITNDQFANSPELTIHQYIENEEHLVAVGSGHLQASGEELRRFTFCEIFRFRGPGICEVDTFHVWTNGSPA